MGYMNPSNNRRVLKGVMNSAHTVYPAAQTGAVDDFHNSMITVSYTIALETEKKIIRSTDIEDEVETFFKRMSVRP